MTVQSEYAIAIATLSDWLKNVVPFFQLMRSNLTLYARLFPRFEQVTGNSLEFGLVHRPVNVCCDWSEKNIFSAGFSRVI